MKEKVMPPSEVIKVSAMVAPPAHGVSFAAACAVWAKIGVLSFGGPAAQIALMHRIVVEEKQWVSEARFLHALNFCMLLPGPEAQQLACYLGWLLHRTWGGIVAGALFVLPGAVAMLMLSVAYVRWQHTPALQAVLYGLKPAVIALVLAALVRIGARTLHTRALVVIAASAFVALAMFHVPFPLVIAVAALTGFIIGRRWPQAFAGIASGHGSAPLLADEVQAVDDQHGGRARIFAAVATALLWLVLWLAPLAALVWWCGRGHVFAEQALFFSKAALITFGGAYAVLPYVGQAAVEPFGWLSPHEMIDGLGLAETTPGPLILVLQFVGFVGAVRQAPGMNPMLAGVIGSIVVLWSTFLPSYLYIFTGAPFIERLRRHPALTAALTAVTAAVVGVILNLALWFSVQVLFTQVHPVNIAGTSWSLPVLGSIDWRAATFAVAASVALIRFKVGMVPVLITSVLIGSAWRIAMGNYGNT